MGVVVVSDFIKIVASAFNGWEEKKWTEARFFVKFWKEIEVNNGSFRVGYYS